MKHFQREMLFHVRKHDSDLNNFILDHWKNNKHSNNTFNIYFQEVFLYKTGIISINTLPLLDYKNKYIPSITFNNENIYNQSSGISRLSKNPLTLKEAEIYISDYLIKYCLPILNLEKVKEALK